jgi:hypothetical protein
MEVRRMLPALENGYRCQFVRAQDLFDEMYASLADRSTRQLVKRLARLDVLQSAVIRDCRATLFTALALT